MIASVKIYPWQEPEYFSSNNLPVDLGDKVIVETGYGAEMGEVTGILKNEPVLREELRKKGVELRPILKKAAGGDIEAAKKYEEKNKEALALARQKNKIYGLKMKFIGVSFGFDGSKVAFAFVSEKRVDFRELAKDLSCHFHKSVRLQQIGSRDEARGYGDYGPCGRALCCKMFKGELKSVSTSAAHLQQIDHRGSARLSGLCGRLRCCLSYEADYYEEVAKKMPPIGKIVNTAQWSGVVKKYFLLKEEVGVELENKSLVRVHITKI